MATTPRTLTRAILDFCRELEPDRLPFFVPVIPDIGAEPNECHLNVERKIRKAGGNVQYGWLIREWPGVWFEAEFHSVWVTSSGSFLDITPQEGWEKNILFLPDSRRVWERKFIPNRIKPLRTDPVMRRFLEVVGEIYRLCGEYCTAEGRSLIPLERLLPLEKKRSSLSMQLARTAPSPLTAERRWRRLQEKKMRGREKRAA